MADHREEADSRLRALWVDYVDSAIRRRRLILIGTGITWLAILALWLLGPARYLCDATLSIPPVPLLPVVKAKEGEEKPRTGGVSFGGYKKIERFVADGAALHKSLNGILADGSIDRLQEQLDQHLSPIASGTRDDVARSAPTDTVVAVRLQFSSPDRDQATKVVEALASLLRLARVNVLAADRMESMMFESVLMGGTLREEGIHYRLLNESLRTVERELGQLSSPASTGASGREVLDVKDGGHLYLPLPVQLVGVRAEIIENEHKLRLTESAAWVQGRRLQILRELVALLQSQPGLAELDERLTSTIKDITASEKRPDAQLLITEIETLRDSLRVERDGVRFLQQPTVSRSRSGSRITMLLALSAAVWVGLAWVVESWSRSHA